MTTILFVKTSSLGDVVHNCPAVSDAARAFPGAAIDWVVEEPFAGIAAMHRAVRRVIPVAVRRWRGALWKPSVWSEIGALRRQVRGERYDAVIDTQSLLKSALITTPRVGHAPRHGPRERARMARSRFYDVRHPVPRELHAVERNRLLTASALGYELSEAIDYGLRVPQTHKSGYVGAPHHDEPRRQALAGGALGRARPRASARQRCCPWGSERGARAAPAHRARHRRNGRCREKNLEELARLFVARAVVGLDTGLTHLAAALGVPTVGIYCGSDPALTGLYGAPRARNAGRPGAANGRRGAAALLA